MGGGATPRDSGVTPFTQARGSVQHRGMASLCGGLSANAGQRLQIFGAVGEKRGRCGQRLCSVAGRRHHIQRLITCFLTQMLCSRERSKAFHFKGVSIHIFVHSLFPSHARFVSKVFCFTCWSTAHGFHFEGVFIRIWFPAKQFLQLM